MFSIAAIEISALRPARGVTWHQRIVTTAIFKEPVHIRVALCKLNLDGDHQADLTVHGGDFKAVYC